ncbi:MAG: hemopexin repeat-containing protein [Planctomycetota bacterium]|nr:hemopexin repeat-containing protein [Planctomycetota bacterium]
MVKPSLFILILSALIAPGIAQAQSVDAALQNEKGAQIIFGERVLTGAIPSNIKKPGSVSTVVKSWQGAWAKGIDAALYWKDNKCYFFKGSEYLRFDLKSGTVDKGYPRPIKGNWPGLWDSGIDAAVNWGNGKAYFFKGSNYIRYSIEDDKADKNYPASIKGNWPGLWNDKIDAACHLGNNRVVFFRDKEHLIYETKSDKVQSNSVALNADIHSVFSKNIQVSPAPNAKHVLMIGIDGCRPDALKAANAPTLHNLINTGAYASHTRILGPRKTNSNTVSGPGWSSLMTGVWADKHGVNDNSFKGRNYRRYPHFFERLKSVRPKSFTASIASWGPIPDHLVSYANLNLKLSTKKGYHAADETATKKAVGLLTKSNPDALFLYFGNLDETGHSTGFHPKNPKYMHALETIDSQIARVLTALRARPAFDFEDWLIIVCTDHGGHKKGHGGGHKNPAINEVFLIFHGRSVKKGLIKTPSALVDAPVTALTHLGVTIKKSWGLDGKVLGIKEK